MNSARNTLTTVLVNFNHARYLPHSLGSILAQTRPSDELIVIDDTSTDNSVEVITSFLPRHGNARLIRNRVNQGCFANVNDGLKVAQGDVIHLAAADDVFYPNFYQVGMALLQAYPQSALFTSRSDIIDENGHNLDLPTPWQGYPSHQPAFIDPVLSARLLMREDGWFMGNTALFSREAVQREGGFPLEMQSFADGYICRLLAAKDGVCFSPEILGAWRRMAGGFAASLNDNPERARALIAAAEQKMLAAGAAFPPGYAMRWKGRQQFELQRHALSKAAAKSASRGVMRRRTARAIEKFRAALLLLRLRPWDAMANLRQRIALYRGRN